MEFSVKSRGDWTSGQHVRSCLLSFGNATKDCTISKRKMSYVWQQINIIKGRTHNVLLSSASGSSVARRRFSKEIFSLGRSFQANNTAIWNVVTSKSNLPTAFANCICETNSLFIYWFNQLTTIHSIENPFPNQIIPGLTANLLIDLLDYKWFTRAFIASISWNMMDNLFVYLIFVNHTSSEENKSYLQFH